MRRASFAGSRPLSDTETGFIRLHLFLISVLLSGLVAAALGTVPRPAQAKQGYSYRQVVSKRCGSCGGAVSTRSHAGQRCPHCGVYWGYENKTQRTRRTTTRSARTKHVRLPKPVRQTSKRPSRRRSANAARRVTYYRVPPVYRATYTAPVRYEPVTISRPTFAEPFRAPTFGNDAGSAIQRIRDGAHSNLPEPTTSVAYGNQGNGMTIENGTGHTLTIYFRGPSTQTVTIPDGQKRDVSLFVGNYEVAGEIPGSGIRPFYGQQEYQSSTHYWLKFFLAPR